MDEPILPQRPTDERAEISSIEWLFGPAWPGDRLIARVAAGAVQLTDAAGQPATAPEVQGLLARGVTVPSAIMDGVSTSHGLGEDRSAFVGLDLLALDGESLLDVPFQERRRLLESVLEQGPQVRIGPLVKQPLGGWLDGWRQAGFSHYLAWHQNARYHPGELADDWLRIPIEAAPAPGLLRRVVGGGRQRTRRIR
jgi:bifunctional non-homologous end joining protein LigD